MGVAPIMAAGVHPALLGWPLRKLMSTGMSFVLMSEEQPWCSPGSLDAQASEDFEDKDEDLERDSVVCGESSIENKRQISCMDGS